MGTEMTPWAFLMGGILIYDTWLLRTGRRTLSSHYQQASNSHPVGTAVVTLYVVAHLHGKLPRRGDLLYGIGAIAGMEGRLTRPRPLGAIP